MASMWGMWAMIEMMLVRSCGLRKRCFRRRCHLPVIPVCVTIMYVLNQVMDPLSPQTNPESSTKSGSHTGRYFNPFWFIMSWRWSWQDNSNEAVFRAHHLNACIRSFQNSASIGLPREAADFHCPHSSSNIYSHRNCVICCVKMAMPRWHDWDVNGVLFE